MKNKKAFTLVEIIIGLSILCILLASVYKIFIGGSKTAGKGQWINETVDQMRNALNLLSSEIKSATYPTTMFKDKIYDPCKNSDINVPKKYYLRILKKSEPIKVPESGEIKIMDWYVCKTEKPDQNIPGEINHNQLYLVFKNKTGSNITGDLVLKTEKSEYTTNSTSDYAKSGKLNMGKTSSRTRVLVNDVESITFKVAGSVEGKNPLGFCPISVTIRTLYPKDVNVYKENSIMATPQVAIILL